MNSTQKPIIVNQSVSNNTATYILFIPKNLVYFQGHFPDYPLLPGVVQVHWVMELAKPIAPKSIFTGIDRLKFMHPIFPECSLHLNIEAANDTSSLNFQYFMHQTTYSSGKINFGAHHA